MLNFEYTGVLASHSALKEHTETLEATLAKRESSVAAMGAHVNEELGRKDNEVVDLRRQIKEVQQLLDAEKQSSKELKKQVRYLYCVLWCKIEFSSAGTG